MKRLQYKFSGNVNQLHDELLRSDLALTGFDECDEEIKEPVFADVIEHRPEEDNPNVLYPVIIGKEQVGERVRTVAKVSEPRLRVESIDDILWLTVPSDYDEDKLAAIVSAHKPTPIAEPVDLKAKLVEAETIDDVKALLLESGLIR